MIPDGITPKVAWRAWMIGTAPNVDEAVLMSLNGGVGGTGPAWPSGRPLKARCPMLDSKFSTGPLAPNTAGINVATTDPLGMHQLQMHMTPGSVPTTYDVDDGEHRLYFTKKSYLVTPRAVAAEFVIPAEACSCGIYAHNDLSYIQKNYETQGTVIGRVALWGRIVVSEQGFRAQYAYPQSIFLHDDVAFAKPRLAHYGIPILKASDLVLEPLGKLQEVEQEIARKMVKANHPSGSAVTMSQLRDAIRRLRGE